MEREKLKLRLEDAHKMLALAEEGLDKAMRELSAPSGIDKTMIATVLEDAFEKLRAARKDVAEIDQLLLL
jgi:hypothetical protein